MEETSKSTLTISNHVEIFSILPQIHNEKNKINKKSKKFKTPNPYLLFCQDRRTELHALNPGKSSRDITKELADEWKKMTPADKKKYQKEYNAAIPQNNHMLPNSNQIFINIQAADGTVLFIPAYTSK